jgi:hypothetical protein
MTHNKRAMTMNTSGTPKLNFDIPPKPIRAEWEKTIAALRPFLSDEKFAETEKVHWRMYERASRWYTPDGR